MPSDYLIREFHGMREWRGNYGPMIDYSLSVEGYPERVTLTQKPDTAKPKVGQVVFGSVEVQNKTTKAGEPFIVHKLRKEQRDDTMRAPAPAGPPQTPPITPAAGGAPPRAADSRGARIERQHSQEMALRFAAVEAQHGKRMTLEQITQTTDHFCQDIEDYDQGRAEQPPLAPAATPTSLVSAEQAQLLYTRAKRLPEARVLMELVALGVRDITQPLEQAIAGLDAEQAGKFDLSLEHIAAEEVEREQRLEHADAMGVNSTDDIPF